MRSFQCAAADWKYIQYTQVKYTVQIPIMRLLYSYTNMNTIINFSPTIIYSTFGIFYIYSTTPIPLKLGCCVKHK